MPFTPFGKTFDDLFERAEEMFDNILEPKPKPKLKSKATTTIRVKLTPEQAMNLLLDPTTSLTFRVSDDTTIQVLMGEV